MCEHPLRDMPRSLCHGARVIRCLTTIEGEDFYYWRCRACGGVCDWRT